MQFVIDIDQAKLLNLGAERLWEQFQPQIVQALAEQDEELRAAGPCKATFVVKVRRAEDGIAFGVTAKLELPAFQMPTSRGSISDGKLYRQDTPNQLTLPIWAETEEPASPEDAN